MTRRLGVLVVLADVLDLLGAGALAARLDRLALRHFTR